MQTTAPTTRLILACSIASLLSIAPAALADSGWTGAVSNDWNNAANWNNGLPGGTNAVIQLGGGGNPPFTATISANVANVNDLLVARSGGPAILNHTAGSIVAGAWLDVGTDGGNGTYNVADTNSTGGTLTGFGLGSGSVTADRIWVGGVDFSPNGGTGVMNINTTGIVQAGPRMYVGFRGNGTLRMDNGTINTGSDLEIGGKAGTGVFSMSGGTVNAGTGGAWHFVGRESGIAGGDGTLNISGGLFNNNFSANRFYVGEGNSTGKVVMSGGTLNNQNGNFSVGLNNLANATTSSVSMSGGTINAGNFFVGGSDEGAGKGKLTLNGSTALLNAGGELWIGDNGATSHGQLDLSAGTVQANNWLAIGRAGATGLVNLSGSGVLKKTGGAGSSIIIGSLGGNGTVQQTGGQMFTDGGGNILLGENSNTGTWNISAGVASADQVRLGAIGGGAGVVNLSGTGAITTTLVAIAANDLGNGTLTQTGGTLNVTDIDVKASLGVSLGIYNLSGGVVNMSGSMSLDNGSFGFTGGKITRADAGFITFNGNLTIGAAAATLKLDADKAFDVNGAFDITTGVTFEVNGLTIPASLPGVLQTGSFLLGFDDSIIGTFSQLTTTLPGLVDLSGATFISEAAGEGGGFDPGADRVYWVEEDAGVVTLQYSVPEPTTFGLLALAGLGLASRRRRK